MADAKTQPQPLLDITSSTTLERCRNMKRATGLKDLFICSYPKSGTTWMQHICLSLLAKGLHKGHVSELAPFYEADSTWETSSSVEQPVVKASIVEKQSKMGWRVYNTHLWWQYLPKHEDARYIYVVRDGRDAAVSFFHHLSHQLKSDSEDSAVVESTFSEFLQDLASGSMPYGSWAQHLSSFDNARKTPGAKLLFVRFEDLLSNLRFEVDRIVEFLQIGTEKKTVDNMIETFKFEWMRKHMDRFQPITVRWKGGFKFIRKGKSGDHKALFGSKEEKSFTKMLQETFPSGLPSWARLYSTSK
mmetsp:Transcript_12455/g.30671  ORF Transcript_12455/g.30671 Transcript_12455/m.30671 type:complete len:302 (+) Transcript_12455:35-940(+)